MKDERIHIRVSKKTKESLQDKTKKYRTTISNYMTALIDNKTVKVQAIPDENAIKLILELSTIGRNLWLIIKNDKLRKISEKLRLELLIIELQRTVGSIKHYYDCKNCDGNRK